MKTFIYRAAFSAALAGSLAGCAQPGPQRHQGMQSMSKDGTAGAACSDHMQDMKAHHERMPMHAVASASAPHDHQAAQAQGANNATPMHGECKMMQKP